MTNVIPVADSLALPSPWYRRAIPAVASPIDKAVIQDARSWKKTTISTATMMG